MDGYEAPGAGCPLTKDARTAAKTHEQLQESHCIGAGYTHASNPVNPDAAQV